MWRLRYRSSSGQALPHVQARPLTPIPAKASSTLRCTGPGSPALTYDEI
ncbi:hypothetical protein IFU30_12495 [Plantibacter sp. CFBP 8798]|nr:hypothetical protein [Plantibacter sp. CFBP 8798]MBD8467089.1 hypothetical protein [Plantibacter sp. CFBP 8798]